MTTRVNKDEDPMGVARTVGLPVAEARAGLIPQSDWDSLEAELEALHTLHRAAGNALNKVPHQKGCARVGHDAAECTCIRADVATLEDKLTFQLDTPPPKPRKHRYYVSECPDTGRQFLVESGKDGNICELTPATVRRIGAAFAKGGRR